MSLSLEKKQPVDATHVTYVFVVYAYMQLSHFIIIVVQRDMPKFFEFFTNKHKLYK